MALTSAHDRFSILISQKKQKAWSLFHCKQFQPVLTMGTSISVKRTTSFKLLVTWVPTLRAMFHGLQIQQFWSFFSFALRWK